VVPLHSAGLFHCAQHAELHIHSDENLHKVGKLTWTLMAAALGKLQG
jgi:hypothetical protein